MTLYQYAGLNSNLEDLGYLILFSVIHACPMKKDSLEKNMCSTQENLY
jgi:hypothetical protein